MLCEINNTEIHTSDVCCHRYLSLKNSHKYYVTMAKNENNNNKKTNKGRKTKRLRYEKNKIFLLKHFEVINCQENSTIYAKFSFLF